LRAQIEQLSQNDFPNDLRDIHDHRYREPEWEGQTVVRLDDVLALLDATPTETPDYKALYHELLYEVANKVPGESRHESARRIIRQHETPSGEQASAKSVLDATETP